MMKEITFYTIVFTFFLISKSGAVSPTDSVNVAPFGKVYIYKQTDTPRNVAIIISGDAGWKSGVVGFAETFSKMNNLVIGVDVLRYFKDLRQRTDDCYNVAADFVQLATVIEKKYNFSDYRPAVIMGYSSGATLVYGILAQARPGTFIGGISLGFCPDIEQVNNLPVVITNAKSQIKDAPVALLISGDGGWYAFEQLIADHLSKLGIPTVGLDSKKYFWKRRSPEETASDMAILLRYYSKEWGKERFILIGYSLGAEIVPFIVNRLPEEMKSMIVSAVLLSPEISTDFEIHISNMLGMGNRQNTYNVIDEIIKMQSVPALIIFGNSEKSQVPGLLTGTSVKVRLIPGDHHYKFNLPLIIQTMKDNKAF